MSGALQVSRRAEELRVAFDRSFVEAAHFEAVTTADFLLVHVGGDPYALRLAEIAGLYADKKVTALPSRVSELRGVAGFRGAMVPVYDLATMLRYAPASAPRWIVLSAEAPVGFAFDAFDGHFRSARPASEGERSDRSEHVREVVSAARENRPVVNLPSIVAAVRKLGATAGGPKKEQ